MSSPFRLLLFPALALLLLRPAQAQAPKQEFRGAWIATVANLDWPKCTSGCSSATQQADLIDILDGLKESGVNAVVFQVRTESDALYDSPFEPWSYWLTGEQGKAPDPYYDPLAFAVEEAHKRGMELHAWINPYRADRGSDYPKAANHVTRQHPEWLLSFSQTNIKILDPGLPEVVDYVTSIAADIVRRYDVDGLHYDDYFYPYPNGGFSGITNEDADTFAAYPRGFSDIGDWRRDNVNRLVTQIDDSLRAVRPEAVHGVSPFGIWKNGVPSGISGLDAYNVIYADAVAWLDAQDVDYLAPQLYWSSQRAFDTNGDGTPDQFNRQRFTDLAPWWASVRNDRHIYPGLAAYRAGGPGYGPEEIPTQIRATRSLDGTQGTIIFRSEFGLLANGLGLADTLRTDLYRHPALPPTMPWKSLDAPAPPQNLQASSFVGSGGEPDRLEWDAPDDGDAEARFYAVYRIPQSEASDLDAALQRAENLLAVTGETEVFLNDSDNSFPPASGPQTYVVTSVSSNSVESTPSNAVQTEGGVATEPGTDALFALLPARPNPVTARAEVVFTLGQPATVSLRVLDALGREVVRLVDAETRAAATHTVSWRPAASLSSGTYFLVLDADGARSTQPVTVVR